MSSPRRLLVLIVTASLALAACTGGATPAPSSPPAATSSAAAATTGPTATPTPVSLKIGFSSYSPSGLVLFATQESGAFKKNGITAEIIYVEGGSRLMQNLLSNALDMAYGLDTNAAMAATAAGSDTVIIGQASNKITDIVVGGKGITKAADMKGKAAGVSDLGGQADLSIRYAFEQLGLGPNDVQILNVGGESTRVAALIAGSVQATIMDLGLTKTVVEPNGFTTLFDFTKSSLVVGRGLLGARKADLTSKREVFTRVMKSFIEGIAWYTRNKAQAVNTLATYAKTDAKGIPALEVAYDTFVPTMAKYPKPTVEGFKQPQIWSTNAQIKALNLATVIDSSIVEELERQNYADQFYK
jgi:NitT/TauT family transport system substrate-binding protein